MLRFGQVLIEQYRERQLDVETLRPEPVVARGLDTRRGLGKWLGYVDKFVVFPRRLTRRLAALGQTPVVAHVCDHSNAVYTRRLARLSHLVTCNDLLAVRSALGEFPENPTRWTGRRLQRMILAGLGQARRVACISLATRRDLLRLTALPPSRADLAYMGLNYPYRPMDAAEAGGRLRKLFGPDDPALFRGGRSAPSFLLHVGGNQWYKNRVGLLRIYAALRGMAPDCPPLVLAGAPATDEMRGFIASEGLSESTKLVHGAGNEDLRALYSTAECLVFPSLEEGFGWPIAEAQACGCRVATTGKAPMTEVGNAAALYFEPADSVAAAGVVLTLLRETPEERDARVSQGFRNAARFSTAQMIEKYLLIYDGLVHQRI
jgi:glycosyltransferase involved in cell wall biosynthesis